VQFVTRAQQLIRETKRSPIEIGLDVGYKYRATLRRPFGEWWVLRRRLSERAVNVRQSVTLRSVTFSVKAANQDADHSKRSD
jgi:transcriptional regulator GlxA family with amidase domain